MFQRGIADYVQLMRQMYETGWEDAGYCKLMAATAIHEAKKLIAWAEQVDADYLESTINELNSLLADLTAERDRFIALDQEEQASQKGKRSEEGS
jgi:hypothetical protein